MVMFLFVKVNDGGQLFLINKFIIVKKKKANRITFTRFSWYSITANMAQRSQRGKRNDERSTDDGMAWNGFECTWLECGTANCKMWMSMMVPDEVDMEHEVVKCGMCIVKEMNVVKGEKDLLRKEV